MNRPCRRLAPLLGLLVWCHQFSAVAATNEEREQLAMQEGEALLLMSRLDRLARLHGTFMELRDRELHGENGLETRAEQWFQSASRWVKGLHSLVATLDAAAGRLGTASVRDELLKQVRVQQAGWQDLAREAERIHNRARAARAKLAALDAPPDGFVEGGNEALAYFRKQVEILSGGFAQLDADFEATKLANLQRVLQPTVAAVEAKLQLALTRAPELAREMERMKGALRADVLITPLRRGVENAYNEFSQHLAALRIFHAEDAARLLDAKIQTSREAILAMQLDPDFYQAALRDIANNGEDARRRLEDILRSMDHRDLVASNFATQAVLLAADCRSAATRGRVDCQRLSQLVILPAEAFDEMTDDQLRFVEDQVYRSVRANADAVDAP